MQEEHRKTAAFYIAENVGRSLPRQNNCRGKPRPTMK
jgi:hypothetical protein